MSSEERVTASIPSSFDRDLENARVLLEEPPWKDNPQKYRKVAEAILRRILTFDATNQSAKRLLVKSLEVPVPVAEPGPAVTQAGLSRLSLGVPIPSTKIQMPPVSPKIVAPKTDVAVAQAPPPRRPVKPPDFSFVVGTSRPVVQKERSSKPPWLLLALAVAGAAAGVSLLVAHRNSFAPDYSAKTPIAAPTVVQASASVVPAASVEPSSSTVTREESIPLASPAKPEPKPKPEPKVEAPPAQPAVAVKSNVQPVAALETGTLAVSSPTTVDIYRNDQLVGSAPTTLVLPAGNQTLEYRHQGTRKLVTHLIRANETTTAMVTFEVTVQINAKPWAQVFIDGSKRQPLGQTPLSDVHVPIGSTLIFENPNFPGKSYRITGQETEIRVSFP